MTLKLMTVFNNTTSPVILWQKVKQIAIVFISKENDSFDPSD